MKSAKTIAKQQDVITRRAVRLGLEVVAKEIEKSLTKGTTNIRLTAVRKDDIVDAMKSTGMYCTRAYLWRVTSVLQDKGYTVKDSTTSDDFMIVHW